ncbi:MAG: hypothetical protein KJO08_11545 [Gammaproteobacteria bacterium]|nr:hypothetical protein [Gammaproteobacteria bacterium]NNJ84318.1 hypothetical protein [Gammaproteobacteria bacterium]
MWELHVSRSFERSIRQIPKTYQQRIVAWYDKYLEGVSDPTDIDKIVWLTKDNLFGRIRFGRYRLGLMVDKEKGLIVLGYVGARGDFYKHFPPGNS